jgi:hypothetical protein
MQKLVTVHTARISLELLAKLLLQGKISCASKYLKSFQMPSSLKGDAAPMNVAGQLQPLQACTGNRSNLCAEQSTSSSYYYLTGSDNVSHIACVGVYISCIATQKFYLT